MDLFEKEKYLKKEEKANAVFTEAYKGMTDEISRVANEPVTIWGKITNWIYLKIFGTSNISKDGNTGRAMNNIEKFQSANAFEKVEKHFEKFPNDSLNQWEIEEEIKRKKL